MQRAEDDISRAIMDHGPLTLGQAKKLAATLPSKEQQLCCGCRKIVCSTESSCCPGKSPLCCVPCLSFHCALGGCLCYGPIPIPFCACYEEQNPGMYSCVDMKGIFYALVAIGEGRFAWFSDPSPVRDSMKVKCYCENFFSR